MPRAMARGIVQENRLLRNRWRGAKQRKAVYPLRYTTFLHIEY